MDEITDQNQPVSHPLSLTCASRDPVGPGAARRSRHCSPARPGPARRAPRGVSRCPGRGRADGGHGGSTVTVMSGRAEPGLDPGSRGWMGGLQSPAAERDAVLARLHGLLLHVARHEAGRRNGWLRLSGPDRDDLARQAAADALEAITAQLDGFCGESRFRTWASKFVMSGVSATAGRRFWQTRTLSLDQEDWDRLPCSLQPPERAERNELLSALRRAVAEGLSGEQRTVFTAVTLHGVPATALAAAPGPTGTRSTRRCSKRAASCAPAWQPIEEISRTFRAPLDRSALAG